MEHSQYIKRIILIAGLCGICLFSAFFFYDKEFNKTIEMISAVDSADSIVFRLSDKGRCLLSNNLMDGKWIQTNENNECIFPFATGPINLYIKNEHEKSLKAYYDLSFSRVRSLEILNSDIYVALGDREKINYDLIIDGDFEAEPVITVRDSAIGHIDEEGYFVGDGVGDTEITVSFEGAEDKVVAHVTDLIVRTPPEFDDSREFLGCGLYTEEENDFLDAILADRVADAGYLTRAGAVAAARFLGLEFPYRINYFTENGRMDSCYGAKVDGEGRYYHQGLYLHESRFSKIERSSAGPTPWGCLMSEYSWDRVRANGLDCSGAITWIIKQAGFEPGDIGAGITPGCKDMTDLGEKYLLTTALEEKTLRVGDLLSGGDGGLSAYGGHIAFVTGIDKDYNIYVAEELGYTWGWGYWIVKYTPDEIVRHFYWGIDMDEFYGHQDGNLTDYWLVEE